MMGSTLVNLYLGEGCIGVEYVEHIVYKADASSRYETAEQKEQNRVLRINHQNLTPPYFNLSFASPSPILKNARPNRLPLRDPQRRRRPPSLPGADPAAGARRRRDQRAQREPELPGHRDRELDVPAAGQGAGGADVRRGGARRRGGRASEGSVRRGRRRAQRRQPQAAVRHAERDVLRRHPRRPRGRRALRVRRPAGERPHQAAQDVGRELCRVGFASGCCVDCLEFVLWQQALGTG